MEVCFPKTFPWAVQSDSYVRRLPALYGGQSRSIGWDYLHTEREAHAAIDYHDSEVSAAAITLTHHGDSEYDYHSDVVQDVPLNDGLHSIDPVAPGYGGYSVGGFGSMNGARANQNNWQIDEWTTTTSAQHPSSHQGGFGIAGVVLRSIRLTNFRRKTQSGANPGAMRVHGT